MTDPYLEEVAAATEALDAASTSWRLSPRTPGPVEAVIVFAGVDGWCTKAR